MASVNILKNDIKDEGLEAMEAALKNSKTLKSICGANGPELDLSGQHLGTEDAKVVAIELEYSRALETITFGDKQAATMKTIMTEADLSGKQLDAPGAIIVAAFLPKCQ